MPYLSKTLRNGKDVGITNGEVVLPVDALVGLSDHEIANLVRELAADIDFLKDYLGGDALGFGTIEHARRQVELEQRHHRTLAVKRDLIRQRRQGFATARAQLLLMLIDRDGYVCQYEGCTVQQDLTIDHIIPLSRGGSDDPANLRLLCKKHNSAKGDS